MRKRKPNDVVRAFLGELANSLDDWDQVRDAIQTGQGDLARRASIDAFGRAAVSFETFRSDWHIAAINRDSSTFGATQFHRVECALVDTGRTSLKPYLSPLAIPKHPTLEQIAGILDAAQSNVSIANHGEWKKLARKHLENPWLEKIQRMHAKHSQVMDTVIAIRNALVHQSPRATNQMNDCLSDLSVTRNHGLRRANNKVQVSGIGAYLNANDWVHGTPRVETFHMYLADLAEYLET